MALSGSFSGSIKSGNYKLRVDWSATQNVTNNTSKITATMYLVIASGWSLNISSRSDNTTAIAGTSYKWSSPAINKGGSTTKLGTVTSGNITHNSDGTKSVTLTATFYVRATISGTYYEKITASATVTLNTIPRATTPTLSSSSVNMGSSVTINTPRASSSFTHDLAYKFAGSNWVSIATNVGTSKAWTVPDLSASIPNASSGTMTIRCITKNGSTTIGTKTVVLTVKVPTGTDYAPKISAVSVTEATAGLAARFGVFIQNKSKLKVSITATASAGATIKSISTTFLGSTYTGSTWTTGLVSKSGTLSLVTKVTDSRGRTASKTTSVVVKAYSKPQVTLFDAYRVNGATQKDRDGPFAIINFEVRAPRLNGGNTLTWVVEYKTATSTEWTALEWFEDYEPLDLNSGGGAATSGDWMYDGWEAITDAMFSIDNQYDLRIVATDYFGAKSTYLAVLPTGAVILDILKDGTGIGIGKVAELPGVCDIDMETRMLGGLRDGCKELWSGGYYMTAGHSPALAEKVSEQLTGIVLVFSRYDTETSESVDEDFVCCFVPKGLVAAMPGKLHAFHLTNAWHNFVGSKAIYIHDDKLVGHNLNDDSGTVSGITFNNKNWVLRYVYGV